MYNISVRAFIVDGIMFRLKKLLILAVSKRDGIWACTRIPQLDPLVGVGRKGPDAVNDFLNALARDYALLSHMIDSNLEVDLLRSKLEYQSMIECVHTVINGVHSWEDGQTYY
jgi:hypothetical protein